MIVAIVIMIVTICYHESQNLLLGKWGEYFQYSCDLRNPGSISWKQRYFIPLTLFNAILSDFRTLCYHDTHSITNLPLQLRRIGLLLNDSIPWCKTVDFQRSSDEQILWARLITLLSNQSSGHSCCCSGPRALRQLLSCNPVNILMVVIISASRRNRSASSVMRKESTSILRVNVLSVL
jgi:hypothetical protein